MYNDTDETFYWILPDELGSTRMIVDENGTPIRAFNYSVYGIPYTFDPGGVSHHLIYDHLFTGQYWDAELDLYNYHARFYDPSIARFLQVDPAHQGFSPYVYVGGMPDIATDPSGMFFGIALVGLAIIGFGGLAWGLGEANNDNIATNIGKSLVIVGSAVILGAAAGAIWSSAAGSVTATASSMPLLGVASAASAIIPEAVVATQEAEAQGKPVEFNFGRMAAVTAVNFAANIYSVGSGSAINTFLSGYTRVGAHVFNNIVVAGGAFGAIEGRVASAASGASLEEQYRSAEVGFLGGMIVGAATSALEFGVQSVRAYRARAQLRGRTPAQQRAIRLGLSRRDIDLVGELGNAAAKRLTEASSPGSARKIIDSALPKRTWRSSGRLVPSVLGHSSDFIQDTFLQRASGAAFLREKVSYQAGEVAITAFAESLSFLGVPTAVAILGRMPFYSEWINNIHKET